MLETIHPPHWPKPVGYANAIAATGKQIYIGGQIGWNAECRFETDDLVEQIKQTLTNIVTVLAAAGGESAHIASMTWYLTDLGAYAAHLRPIGQVYREVIGRHFPAMAVVGVTTLVEPRAQVEIQVIAVLPDA